MDTPAEILTDGVVSLRRWRELQRDELTEVVAGSLAHLGAWLIWATHGHTAETSAEFLARTVKKWADGEAFDFAIYASDELVGGCGIMQRDGGVEIGYWLALGATGRGLMTRSVTLLIGEAFRQGAGYVEIKHDELNVRSGAVPARLGFTLVRKESEGEALAPACSGTNHVWRKDS